MNEHRLWKWALIILGALVLFLSSEGTRTYWKRRKVLNELEQKLEQIRQTNKNLVLEIDRLQNDPRAAEQIARKELGLIQPGEIEYRFVVQRSSE